MIWFSLSEMWLRRVRHSLVVPCLWFIFSVSQQLIPNIFVCGKVYGKVAIADWYLWIFVTDYGPAVIEHCLQSAGFPENVKVGKGFDITTGKSVLNANLIQ